METMEIEQLIEKLIEEHKEYFTQLKAETRKNLLETLYLLKVCSDKKSSIITILRQND
jgi:hypothetical protein